MKQRIGRISILVRDYDEAIQFYTNDIGFELIEDTKLSESKRWVIVAPKGSSNFGLLLAKASTEKQIHCIGNQSGGRVFLFLYTDNCIRDYENYKEKNVNFVRKPKQEEYGTVAVFEDLYGNLWDLIESH